MIELIQTQAPSPKNLKLLSKATTNFASIEGDKVTSFDSFEELWDYSQGTGAIRQNNEWKIFEF